MAFPKKILGIAIGWSDLGRVNTEHVSEGLVRYASHSFCRTRARVGKRKDETVFLYCPKCMVKLKE